MVKTHISYRQTHMHPTILIERHPITATKGTKNEKNIEIFSFSIE